MSVTSLAVQLHSTALLSLVPLCPRFKRVLHLMSIHRAFSVLIAALITFCLIPYRAAAQVQTAGQWQTLPNTMPINPVHIALMHNGKVLIVSGSGNVATETHYTAGIFDPSTGTVTTQPIAWDMFCNGMSVSPEGRPFVMGGT